MKTITQIKENERQEIISNIRKNGKITTRDTKKFIDTFERLIYYKHFQVKRICPKDDFFQECVMNILIELHKHLFDETPIVQLEKNCQFSINDTINDIRCRNKFHTSYDRMKMHLAIAKLDFDKEKMLKSKYLSKFDPETSRYYLNLENSVHFSLDSAGQVSNDKNPIFNSNKDFEKDIINRDHILATIKDNETLTTIVEMMLQDCSQREIANKFGCSTQNINNKLILLRNKLLESEQI